MTKSLDDLDAAIEDLEGDIQDERKNIQHLMDQIEQKRDRLDDLEEALEEEKTARDLLAENLDGVEPDGPVESPGTPGPAVDAEADAEPDEEEQ